jgi:glycosyltransferase involved in cell wall biosynthesis
VKKPKIFVLTHNFPKDEKDMSGIFIKNIQADLADDFEFTVCPIRFGTTMHKLYKNPLKWPRLVSYYLDAMSTAKREFEKDKFDLIWAHWWLPPGLIAARLAKKTRCPLLVTCHGTDAFMLRDLPVLRPLANYVFNRARTVNVVSKYMATITTDKGVVANMPYNQEIFNYQDGDRDHHYIISPTALIKRKNQDILIKAIKDFPELKLKIFGSGILKDELEALAAGIDNVEIHPPIDHKTLAAEYKKAGAIILPSINEGFGLTLVEGAASGCFPMATIDGGMVEIIEQTQGINFTHDPSGNEIKKALRKYLDSLPIDRKALAERARVFSREQIIPRFKQILNDTIGIAFSRSNPEGI